MPDGQYMKVGQVAQLLGLNTAHTLSRMIYMGKCDRSKMRKSKSGWLIPIAYVDTIRKMLIESGDLA